jgi:hypothetical protein
VSVDGKAIIVVEEELDKGTRMICVGTGNALRGVHLAQS